MTLEQFIKKSSLAEFDELEKVIHFAFFYRQREKLAEFTAGQAAKWIRDHDMGNPNVSRLAGKLKNSKDTVRGSGSGSFRLHHNRAKILESEFPQLAERSQEVTDHGTILPPVTYEKTRGYIESLAKQINRSYEEHIFDGCAVLMRRLEEVLLILAYENLKIEAQIKDSSGNYLPLEGIVSNAQSNATLKLGRNGKKTVEKIREMGNYSAHHVTYQCRREFIQEKIEEYRALVNDLLHKSGLR